MNLATILKMLGVKIPPDKMAALEAFIPQIPMKGQQVIDGVNFALKNFDERLKALEVEARWQRRAMLAILSEAKLEPIDLEEKPNEPERIGTANG
jgi:hypothetical protein